jgi:threonyl-tRNA synthetase
MKAAGVRVQVMERASIGKMVRTATTSKTPVMCIVGQKEAEAGTLSVRLYGGSDLGVLPAGEVVGRLAAAVAAKQQQLS